MTNSIETTNIVIQSPNGDYLNPYVKPATISDLGTVKPDGTTITISADGTITSIGGGGGGGIGNACYTATNPALSVSDDNKLTWVVTHNLNTTNIVVSLYTVSTGTEIVKSVTTDSANQITVTFTSSTDAVANTYKIVVLTGEASIGTAGYTENCPALSLNAGKLTWVITHNLNTRKIIASLYTSAGVELDKEVTIDSVNQITVTFSAESDAAAGDYNIVIMSINSVGVDSALSLTSANPVQNSIITTQLNNKANISLSNINSSCIAIDGQWANNFAAIASNVAWDNTTQAATYSLANYLPNDEYNYEVLFSADCNTGGTSGQWVSVALYTDLNPDHTIYVCYAHTRTSSTVGGRGSVILPIGTGRTVTQYTSSSNNANGTYNLYAMGYRRIGTNQ